MTETDERVVNETSPLVGSDNDNDVDSTTDQELQHGIRAEGTGNSLETKSSWYLFLLTLSIGG
jgi:solute carrier family 45 protein 1/2/4